MYVPVPVHVRVQEAKNHFETGGCSTCSGDGFSARYSCREYGHYMYEQFRGSRSGPERHYE